MKLSFPLKCLWCKQRLSSYEQLFHNLKKSYFLKKRIQTHVATQTTK